MASQKVSGAVDEMGMPIPKGGGMPGAAVAAPLIGAGASVIGGILGNKAQSNANKANSQAQAQALAYEREKDAKAEQRYNEDKQRYEFMQKQAYKMKQGVLSRYGIQLPDRPDYPGGSPGGAPGAVPRQPVTLGAIARAVPPNGPGMQGNGPGAPPEALPGGPDPTQWDDWRQYA